MGEGTLPTRRRALAALAGAVWLPMPGRADATLRQAQHFLFGSPVDVRVRQDGDAPADPALAAVMAGLAQIHRRWNAWKPGDLSRLNAAFREGRAVRVAPALGAMIRSAARLERASSGFFNPGIGGAVGAWGFHDDLMRAGARPDVRALAAWRDAAPSLAQIEMRGDLLTSRNPRLQLDFGAYAKGVAIDRALDQLQGRGIDAALVDLGGNLAAMSRAGAPGWHIGIRDPQGEGLVARLTTEAREAVVTSGSYERFRMLDGERIGHILDPGTLAPASELLSVTVVHRSAAYADAAATALLVAGPQRWRPVAERMGVSRVLVIDRQGRGQVTAALAGRLQGSDAAWRSRIAVV
ncbi:FAD:protein FMN transferase [uncultured Piscinibacter sp.]|uniref:FAD:protein FMN transferase n=1 Tax=uncultured Piscinibacter sp. TaxID=1131835 RepID=UPI0026039D05|nr:FAD:protein FMN transferase [uncultured Piscinibacter sp.]